MPFKKRKIKPHAGVEYVEIEIPAMKVKRYATSDGRTFLDLREANQHQRDIGSPQLGIDFPTTLRIMREKVEEAIRLYGEGSKVGLDYGDFEISPERLPNRKLPIFEIENAEPPEPEDEPEPEEDEEEDEEDSDEFDQY